MELHTDYEWKEVSELEKVYKKKMNLKNGFLGIENVCSRKYAFLE